LDSASTRSFLSPLFFCLVPFNHSRLLKNFSELDQNIFKIWLGEISAMQLRNRNRDRCCKSLLFKSWLEESRGRKEKKVVLRKANLLQPFQTYLFSYLSWLITSLCCQVLSEYRQLLINFSELASISFLIGSDARRNIFYYCYLDS